MNNTSYQTVVGVDVAKSKLDLFDLTNNHSFTCKSAAEAIGQLIDSWKASDGKLLVVMEATKHRAGYRLLQTPTERIGPENRENRLAMQFSPGESGDRPVL